MAAAVDQDSVAVAVVVVHCCGVAAAGEGAALVGVGQSERAKGDLSSSLAAVEEAVQWRGPPWTWECWNE